jgi:putative transposase
VPTGDANVNGFLAGRNIGEAQALLIVIGRALPLALRGHRELVLENLALRQQLTVMKRTTSRPRLHAYDRLFWIALTRLWRNWRTAVVFVRADTVVRWHRDWLRRRWTRRSMTRPNGRPRVSREIRTLVREMATANPLWGAPRIHGELRTLGIDVSERTVSRLLGRRPCPPSQTWKTFLANHIAAAASMDFFTVPTLTGRVLFVLVVLSHHRRRIQHLNITEHPTAEWSAQQVVDAFPDETAPRWLHRDRDRIYGAVFQRRVAGMGIAEVVAAPASPWQNPYVERVIGSLRRECLDYVIVLNEAHLRRVLSSYLRYYHRSRTHLGLAKDTPDHRPASETAIGPIVAIPEVGGLHHRYERRAA